jgi:two-component system, chemotaxis family, protein-glutamate methylesterase/glutaminase
MKPPSDAKAFPVICVGGSTGGLDAYIKLLQNLPADLGVAIVIVNHLRVTTTLLQEILPRFSKMPVELISQGPSIRPNHVFIIPPQRDLHVLRGGFLLKPISKPRGWPDVITVFLRSLASCVPSPSTGRANSSPSSSRATTEAEPMRYLSFAESAG